MKYDLMLIGPATRDVNIDYTGKEVHEIGGAVFFCSAAAKAAGANLFASVKIHPDDTDIIEAFKLDSDHVAILPSETTTLMQNTYFTADRERRKAECLAQSGHHAGSDPRGRLRPVSSGRSAVRRFPERADRRAEKARQGLCGYSGLPPS